MAEELLLSSTKVTPGGLLNVGYIFRDHTLDIALQQLATS